MYETWISYTKNPSCLVKNDCIHRQDEITRDIRRQKALHVMVVTKKDKVKRVIYN